MTIDEIRQKKRLLGYSNAQLSDYSGVPLGTVNKILSGETKAPRYATLQALSRALDQENGAAPYRLFETSERDMLLRDSLPAYGTSSDGKRGYTIQDLENLPAGVQMELIDGVFYDMAPPMVRHQQIIASLFLQIHTYIKEKKGSCIPFLSPTGVQLDRDEKTLVLPDLFILCDSDKITDDGKYIFGAPDFVAEVISPSTASKDYIKKAAKYEAAGVREYWIIDPIKEHLLVYDFAHDCTPQIQPLTGKRGVELYERDLQIDLDEIMSIIKRGY
ncbi:MAG: helix-turn-helix domain-containing protein [Lachnospiraceae bacterium]|nr:helix-turn-helix domain-containing protein [Lachnospiraceae bacterium]